MELLLDPAGYAQLAHRLQIARLPTVIRFATDVLSGVPSITIGVFVYAVLVQPARTFSALAG